MAEFKKENTGVHEVLALRVYLDGLTIKSNFKNIEDIMKLLFVNVNVYKIELSKTIKENQLN